jgi:aryl-alcohol dehydrogenase-like predicted oxidoreductase
VLAKLKKEGKIRAVGVSTPEQDQNCVVDLMRDGLVDTVQVIYNIFEQEPAAELLPVAQERGVGVIVRVALDEGSLAGRMTAQTVFDPNDFRARYFAGDRLQRTVKRVAEVEKDIQEAATRCPRRR